MDRPRPDAPRDDDEPLRPDDEHGAAVVRERGAGAHEEHVSDEANLREDESPPGVDPEEDRDR